jgi:hypothetical protein
MIDDLLKIHVDPSSRNILGNERRLSALLLSERKKHYTTLRCCTTAAPTVHDSDRKNWAIVSPSSSFARSAYAAEVASYDSSFPLRIAAKSSFVAPSSEMPCKRAATQCIHAPKRHRASMCRSCLCSLYLPKKDSSLAHSPCEPSCANSGAILQRRQ